jgi:hypothetical protein
LLRLYSSGGRVGGAAGGGRGVEGKKGQVDVKNFRVKVTGESGERTTEKSKGRLFQTVIHWVWDVTCLSAMGVSWHGEEGGGVWRSAGGFGSDMVCSINRTVRVP